MKISERFYLGDPMQHLASELDHMSERAIALLGGAIIDEALADVIKLKLLIDKKPLESQFEGQGGLATFSAKIDLGRLLACYSKDAWSDMHLIRKIRNDAAHSTVPFSFSMSPIRERAKSLKIASSYLHEIGTDNDDPTPALFVYGLNDVLEDPLLRYLGTAIFVTWQFKGYVMQSPDIRPKLPKSGF